MKTQARRWSPIAGWCERTGKQKHESRAGARAQREGVRRRLGAAEALEIYKCRHCGFFHIGHGRGEQ